jgi:hypothetical protein
MKTLEAAKMAENFPRFLNRVLTHQESLDIVNYVLTRCHFLD